MKKKKESNYGIIVLLIMLMGAVGFVFWYEYQKNKPVKVEEKKEETIEHTDEEIKELYENVKMTYEQEYSITKQDLELLETGLTREQFSNELKVAYGIKNIPEEYISKTNTKTITDKDGYVYSGKYIRTDRVKTQLSRIIGPVEYTDTTIVLPNVKYVYSKDIDGYQIYEKEYKPNIEKVTYIESEWDKDNIYITEYVAYTNISVTPNISYTRHNKLLPINITEKNIVENLDIIDAYKYTFSYNENVSKYFLVKIEYINTSE